MNYIDGQNLVQFYMCSILCFSIIFKHICNLPITHKILSLSKKIKSGPVICVQLFIDKAV